MVAQDDLLNVVAEDLGYLKSEWNQSVEDAALRRGSTVLRRLLVDGELQRAWKAAGFTREPTITCSTLAPVMRRYPLKAIQVAAAGGAQYSIGEMRGFVALNYSASQDEIGDAFKDGLPSENIGLRSFVESPAMIVFGEIVARRVLIKYVANKLGGAHHDPKRGKNHEESLFVLLDGVRNSYRLLDKPILYFELLSVGQAIAGSPDIQQLQARLTGSVGAA
jgi:hypothetical protein